MPRAGPSGTQRNASQSQPASTQTQGRKRSERQRHNEDEDNDLDVEDEDEEDSGANGDLAKKVASLVRLAIFNEQRRVPLKRDDISKKVMGSQRSAFKLVFEGAQDVLRSTFGMELVELQTRAAAQETAMGTGEGGKRKRGGELSQSQANGATQPTQTQDAIGLKKRAVTSGAKAYILRSILGEDLIAIASRTDAKILDEETSNAPAPPTDELGARSYGSIISWSAGDALGALGVLHVVLALILLSGKVINDADLRAALRRLKLHEQDPVELPALAPHRTVPLDAYLSELMRKQYIDRVRLGQPTGKRSRAGASQPTQAADDENGAYEWRWGPRAYAEIGEKAIAHFVAEFMAERRTGGADTSSDEDGSSAHRTRWKERETDDAKRLQTTLRGIERAAGDVVSLAPTRVLQMPVRCSTLRTQASVIEECLHCWTYTRHLLL